MIMVIKANCEKIYKYINNPKSWENALRNKLILNKIRFSRFITPQSSKYSIKAFIKYTKNANNAKFILMSRYSHIYYIKKLN